MKTSKMIVIPGLAILPMCLFAQTVEFGKPITTLRASDALPPELRSGPHHRVAERVVNDGYINTYTIQSDFGVMKAVSTHKLRKRVQEVNAIALMQRVEDTDSYKGAVVEAGKETYEGFKNLVQDPQGSFEGAVSGVGRLFRMAGESIRSEQGAGEDSKLEALIGKSKSKRDVAYEFGVDVYSTNPILQEHLERVAWTSYAGKMSITALKAAVPGGLGTVVTFTGSTKLLNDLIATSSPLKLRDINRTKLVSMGIDPLLIDLFIDNQVFTPRQQTYLVAGLEALKTTRHRDQYLRFAIRTSDQEIAAHRAGIAYLYAGYDRNVGRLERFIPMGSFVLAQTEDTAVFIVPVDYLVWTRDTALITGNLSERIAGLPGIKGKELWLYGTVDQRSRGQLEADGWKIFERCEGRLLKETGGS